MKCGERSHLACVQDDEAKAGVLFKIVGEAPGRFIASAGFTEEGKRTVIYNLLQMIKINGFEIVYYDANVTVYKLIFRS